MEAVLGDDEADMETLRHDLACFVEGREQMGTVLGTRSSAPVE